MKDEVTVSLENKFPIVIRVKSAVFWIVTLKSNMVTRLFLVNVFFEEQGEKDNIKIDIRETGL
jgi:hypothetical protein